ncbi:MAG: helix-turn-helix transcriptional regulator [Bacteroidota bacterium]
MPKTERNAKKEYAERLKAFRKAADVSQENLARALGVHQPYIAAVESARISIGIDRQEEIAGYFGLKYYEFSDPKLEIPSKWELRESIAEYVRSANIDPGYLANESPNYVKYIDLLLETDFLSEPKTAREIADELQIKHALAIPASRVSDILSRSPRKDMLEIIRPEQGKGNKYQLKS